MILIAAANPDIIAQCNSTLCGSGPILVVSAAEHLYDTVRRVQPNLTLVDLDLISLEGVSGVVQLKRAHPSTTVLALNVPTNDQLELVLFKSGVRGICAPGAPADHIRRAVTAVIRGELWMRRGLVNRLLEQYVFTEGMNARSGNPEDAHLSALTAREKEIASLIGAGCNNKQIARSLDIAERTVKSHLTEIFRKLGVNDRLGLALKLRTTKNADICQMPAPANRPIPFIHSAVLADRQAVLA